MARIHPVLMVGGSGTRLWPVSRHDRPKQFQHLIGATHSLFQQSVLRCTGQMGAAGFQAPIIIGAERYLSLIEQQLDEIGVAPSAIVLEPSARNTAAVAAVAAACVRDIGAEGDLALMMPSDHHVTDIGAFQGAIERGAATAADDWIVTFGIKPTRPETGFGYIEAGDALGTGANRIAAFTEKPDLSTAQKWLAAGQHSWNSGIFLFPPALMLDELKAHAGEVHTASLAAYAQGERYGVQHRLSDTEFSKSPNISIDFAVMEHTERAAVCGPVICGWSDVGSWPMLAELDDRPHHDDIVAVDSGSSYIRTDGSVMVAAIGLEDFIIVAHEGSVLIMPKGRAQDVKSVIETLKDKKLDHRL